MKYLPTIAACLLGLLFVFSASIVLFGFAPEPEIPEGTPVAGFILAFGSTGYLTFVKVLELLGGVLVAIPRTRNLGLLVLGPIIVNILAFHIFVAGAGILNPMLLIVCVLAAYLLWSARKDWIALALGGTESRT